jgi:hypothetical protein
MPQAVFQVSISLPADQQSNAPVVWLASAGFINTVSLSGNERLKPVNDLPLRVLRICGWAGTFVESVHDDKTKALCFQGQTREPT